MSSLIPFENVFDRTFGNAGNDWHVFDPFREEFFSKNLKPITGGDRNWGMKTAAPLLTADMVETENEFRVIADLPGVNPEDLDISIQGNNLIMKAERKHVHEKNTDTLHTFERSYGQVQRVFRMPKLANMDGAVSNLKNGVLTITFPKLEVNEPPVKKLTIGQA